MSGYSSNGNTVVMDRSSGRDAFELCLSTMDMDLNPTAFEKAFLQTKKAADLQGEVSETQLRAIVDDVISGMEVFEGVNESFR